MSKISPAAYGTRNELLTHFPIDEGLLDSLIMWVSRYNSHSQEIICCSVTIPDRLDLLKMCTLTSCSFDEYKFDNVPLIGWAEICNTFFLSMIEAKKHWKYAEVGYPEFISRIDTMLQCLNLLYYLIKVKTDGWYLIFFCRGLLVVEIPIFLIWLY